MCVRQWAPSWVSQGLTAAKQPVLHAYLDFILSHGEQGREWGRE